MCLPGTLFITSLCDYLWFLPSNEYSLEAVNAQSDILHLVDPSLDYLQDGNDSQIDLG